MSAHPGLRIKVGPVVRCESHKTHTAFPAPARRHNHVDERIYVILDCGKRLRSRGRSFMKDVIISLMVC